MLKYALIALCASCTASPTTSGTPTRPSDTPDPSENGANAGANWIDYVSGPIDWSLSGLQRTDEEYADILATPHRIRGELNAGIFTVREVMTPGGERLQPPATAIWHVIVIVQENHTFDTYFGDKCTGAPGVSCTQGFACCESIWGANPRWGNVATMPFGAMELTDYTNGCSDPPHNANPEMDQMHLLDGTFRMDNYPAPGSNPCATNTNRVAALHADHGLGNTYWNLAAAGALADRYFQPLVGASTANDMFLARAGYVYQDNYSAPNNAWGNWCAGYHTGATSNAPNTELAGGVFLREYQDTTIGDLFVQHGVSFATYAEGYEFMRDLRDNQCPAGVGSYPYTWDPADNPFNFYPQFRDKPKFARDLSELQGDIFEGRLPRYALIRSLGTNSEHPSHAGLPSLLTDGQAFVQSVVDTVLSSEIAEHTLILITWDEGGGFYDHVPPPMSLADGTPLGKAGVGSNVAHTTDGQAHPKSDGAPECFRCQAAPDAAGQLYYGTRVPLLAVGTFAQPAAVSHTVMEHSSIVKFLEWNFLGKRSGQLGTRDAHVNNLGSMLRPELAVPSGVAD